MEREKKQSQTGQPEQTGQSGRADEAERERLRELVCRARDKDVDAFTELYEGISKSLYCTAYYCLKNQQDAEDAVSETVLAAWSQIGNLREADAFRAWMFKILSNRCKARLKQYVERPLELREDIGEPDGFDGEAVASYQSSVWEERTSGSDMAGRLDLREALKKLVSTDRMILILSVLDGYTTREVAEMLHMKHATVRSRKSRALEKLAELLA